MSKIICDICGTQYPETATQCPICGCAKPSDAKTVEDLSQAEGAATYTYVKGGRFSKANVKKRNKAALSAQEPISEPLPEEPEDGEEKANRGLIIAAVALLLAIVAMCFYIAVRFFLPAPEPKPNQGTQPTTTAATDAPTIQTEATPATIPCTGLTLDSSAAELTAEGDFWLINATKSPADSTDEIIFISSDPAVATVNSEGRVTAVGEGEAIITVICGDQNAEFTIYCLFSQAPETIPTEEVTEPTEAPTETTEATEPEETADPDFVLELNREDFSLFFAGDSWNVYDGDLDPSLITWSTGNSSVATVVDGLVTAVGAGSTTIYAEYNGQTVTCIVYCQF